MSGMRASGVAVGGLRLRGDGRPLPGVCTLFPDLDFVICRCPRNHQITRREIQSHRCRSIPFASMSRTPGTAAGASRRRCREQKRIRKGLSAIKYVVHLSIYGRLRSAMSCLGASVLRCSYGVPEALFAGVLADSPFFGQNSAIFQKLPCYLRC